MQPSDNSTTETVKTPVINPRKPRDTLSRRERNAKNAASMPFKNLVNVSMLSQMLQRHVPYKGMTVQRKAVFVARAVIEHLVRARLRKLIAVQAAMGQKVVRGDALPVL